LEKVIFFFVAIGALWLMAGIWGLDYVDKLEQLKERKILKFLFKIMVVVLGPVGVFGALTYLAEEGYFANKDD